MQINQEIIRFQRKKIYRGVEQLVARWAHNPKVVGSSPTSATSDKATFVALSF